MILLLLQAACVTDAPVPFLGDCADYPEGVYEYGQIGIGTCLAGPADIRWLPDGHSVAVSNANPWLNFTGGSVLTLDMDAVDLDVGRNVVSDLVTPTAALAMPSFSGAMDLDAGRNVLLVTNRLSEDGRTRESDDNVWFVDVSDPAAPTEAALGEDGAAFLPVGYDPNAILYDDNTDRAYVIDRTSHLVSVLDMGTTPVSFIHRDGEGTVTADSFVDVDGSGSKADFVTLNAEEATSLTPHHWDFQWGEGTLRLWQPNQAGAYRLTSTGADWKRSAIEAEAAVENTDGLYPVVGDPDVFVYTTSDGYRLFRMAFVSDGHINYVDGTSYSAGSGDTWDGEWSFGTDALLTGTDGGWDETLGGPNIVQSDGYQWLFYDGTGADGAQAIGLAYSGDGLTYARYLDGSILSSAGERLADPYVYGDDEAGLWRMFFTRFDAEGAATLGQAESTDLVTWEVLDWSHEGQAPAIASFNGELRLYYNQFVRDQWMVMEARSLDGYTFDEPTWVADVEDSYGDEDAPGIALQAEDDRQFSMIDESGGVFSVALAPGDTVTTEEQGFTVRVAVGFLAGPDDVGDVAASGIRVDARVGERIWATATDADEQTSILGGSWDGETFVWDGEPALEAAAGGDFDLDGVSSPVVFEDGAGYVMLYAGEANGVTSIGRAVSGDGQAWSVDSEAVLVSSDTWESVSMEPGSVELLDDGSYRLWYTGFDGADWRIGYAESTDGQTWTRVAGETYAWAFDSGIPGDWDDSGVRHPMVLRDAGVDRMWFSGFDGSNWQIGYAERDADGVWTEATDAEGSSRPVLAASGGSFGAGAVVRPVVVADDATGGWDLLYTGEDDNVGRIGHGVALAPDRIHRELRLPTLADTWGFSSVPTDETGAIDLDGWVDDQEITARGCAALASDDARGFVYVACKLVPLVFVLDVRDDSTDTTTDLNYLGIESVLFVQTTTDEDSGFRDLLYDVDNDVLWGLQDDPEGVYSIKIDDVADDDDAEFVRDRIIGILPLPRADERDQGASTMASVGPGSLAKHPDGHHLFVTNFNANSVTAFDLDLGPLGTQVGEAEDVGENPYAIALSPDGSLGVVGNYAGEVVGNATNSTLAVIDTDPASDSFMKVRTWVVNQ